MAQSPAHRFGQIIGDVLELMLTQDLEDICQARGLYLDRVGAIRPARKGKKLSWYDKFGNKHDLDFVVERNGSQTRIGEPVAFIESAWRRYTKHSKNKAQEIQAAVLPVAENYQAARPFLGVLLGGVYTEPSIAQLESTGFEVLYITYPEIVSAFATVGIDANYGEDTPLEHFQDNVQKFEDLTDIQVTQIVTTLNEIAAEKVTQFKRALEHSLDRQISTITIIPLYGQSTEYTDLDAAVTGIQEIDQEQNEQSAPFNSIEILIRFTNSDEISGKFYDKERAVEFLNLVSH